MILLNPKPTDPMQAKVMYIMPVVFSVMFFIFAAGLVLPGHFFIGRSDPGLFYRCFRGLIWKNRSFASALSKTLCTLFSNRLVDPPLIFQ